MSDTRTPFEHAAALTAASRNTDHDTARAALIGESVQWITDHLHNTADKDMLWSAIRGSALGLSSASMDYATEAERWYDAIQATDNDTDEERAAYNANLAKSAAISSVATALNTTGPF